MIAIPVQAQDGLPDTIIKISPSRVYNNSDQEIFITIISNSQPQKLFINSQNVPIINWTVSQTTQQIEVKAKLPKGFVPGSYPIQLELKSGKVVISQILLEILPSLNSHVTSISPSTIQVYPQQLITLRIEGDDLEDIISTDFSGVDCLSQNDVCKITTKSNNEIILELNKDQAFFNSIQSLSGWNLLMADGSKIALPELKIADRIVPWNSLSWIGLVLFMVLSLVVGSFSAYMENPSQKSVEKEIVPVAEIRGQISANFIGNLVLLVIAGIISAVINIFYKSWSWSFLAIIFLMALNLWLPFFYAYSTGKYYPVISKLSRYSLASLLMLIILLAPFVADYLRINWIAYAIEGGALILILVIGDATLRFAKDQFPPVETIVNKIQDVLYQKGEVSLKKDLSNFPKKRALKILYTYYDNNKAEENLLFDKKRQILSLQINYDELHDLIQNILEEQGTVSVSEDLQNYPNGLAVKALKSFFDQNKEQGDLQYQKGKLFLTGQVNAALYTSIEQLLYRNGKADIGDLRGTGRARIIKALNKYYTDHKDNQGLVYNEQEGHLAYTRQETIKNISQGFERVRRSFDNRNDVRDFDETLYDLMVSIWLSLNFGEGKAYQFSEFPSEYKIYSTSPSELISILPDPFPIILFLAKTTISSQQIQELKKILIQLNVKSRFAVLIDFAETSTTKELIRRQLVLGSQENMVVLSQHDLIDIQTSIQEVRLAFMELVQKQVDLSLFSPYQSEAPTTKDMFFGREDEIRKVVNSIDEQSIAIVGARRIGKTSMLHQIRRILNERGKILFYLDCYHIGDYNIFIQEINTRWDLQKQLGVTCKSLIDFPKIISQVQDVNPGRQVVLQFDEIDRLLSFDLADQNGEVLFRMFRSLAQEKRCQFIFSGERMILDQLSNPSSCFFNFTKEIQLGLLEEKSAMKLISDPMQLVGVHIKNPEEIFPYMFYRTSGHPNLIQYLCELCLNELSDSRSRILSKAIVEKEVNTSEYRSRYQKTFWSQASPTEKALTIGVIENHGLSESQAINYLKQMSIEISIRELERAFRYLTLNQLLINRDGIYQLQPIEFIQSISDISLDQWKYALTLEYSRN